MISEWKWYAKCDGHVMDLYVWRYCPWIEGLWDDPAIRHDGCVKLDGWVVSWSLVGSREGLWSSLHISLFDQYLSNSHQSYQHFTHTNLQMLTSHCYSIPNHLSCHIIMIMTVKCGKWWLSTFWRGQLSWAESHLTYMMSLFNTGWLLQWICQIWMLISNSLGIHWGELLLLH